MEGLDLRDTGPASDAVRLELQADCFAGAWVGDASTTLDDTGTPFLEPVTEAQVRDGTSQERVRAVSCRDRKTRVMKLRVLPFKQSLMSDGAETAEDPDSKT